VTIHRGPKQTADSFRRFSRCDGDRFLSLHDAFAVQMRELANQFMYIPTSDAAEIAARVGVSSDNGSCLTLR
jgi:hypothetical protein